MKKKVTILIVGFILVIIGIITGFLFTNKLDTIEYKGNTYVYLEYVTDVFIYDFISNDYFEVDEVHPVRLGKWDAVYFNGDLFILKSQVRKATKYYSDDDNYEWFVTFDEETTKDKYLLAPSRKDIEYLYSLDKIKRKETMVFDDIESFAEIRKISKDGNITGIISLAKVNSKWYWKTEVMTKDDREYIIPLPNELSDTITKLRLE